MMIYPPAQGKSGQHLMQLWREYLEQYADKEGDVEGQSVVAAYHTVEILTFLSRTFDKTGRYKEVIDQRLSFFREGSKHAEGFLDCVINATFSIYNSLNVIGHQLTEGNAEAAELIRKVDDQVHKSAESEDAVERSAAALRAGFPLLGLVSIVLDNDQAMINVIRQVEQRFAAGTKSASSNWEQLLNALYRIVELMQVFALLTDPDLKDQINQVATRFQEEDQAKELRFKLRNGFCRFFELGHLLAGQVDAMM
jgi:hypothetical protein